MALGDAYATIDQLKIRLGINDVFDDSILTGALNAASRSVESFCSRQFNDAGTATARLFYPDDLTSVTVDDFSTTTGLILKTDESGDGSFPTTWAATDFQAEPLGGLVSGVPGFPFNRLVAVGSRLFLFPTFTTAMQRAPVQVTARWGWAAVPDPVVEATLVLAEELAKLKDAPFGVAGFSQFGAVRVRDNPKIKMLLYPYRVDGGILVG